MYRSLASSAVPWCRGPRRAVSKCSLYYFSTNQRPIVLYDGGKCQTCGVWKSHAFSTHSAPLPNPSGTRSKASVMQKIKDGALHYWNGTKLLGLETRISFGILRKLLRGEKLIRREYLQLLRTSSDLFRLVPFIVIALIPFLEFALPVLLKLFPNMLPSTFEDKFRAEEKLKKQLKVKLETAKFLQAMAESMSKEDAKVADLKNLFQRARTAGQTLTAQEIFDVSKHLHDSVKLENLGRAELLSLCRYMGLVSFGTDNYLRHQIYKAIKKLKADDELISQEGIDSLTLTELSAACHARGIRTIGVSEYFMRRELQQWLDLQLRHSVPASLLILSRALALSENIPIEAALKDAMAALPEPIIDEAAQRSAETPDPSERIKVIREQQDLITAELAAQSAVEDKSGTGESIDSISDAVVTLTSSSPALPEREDLAELKQGLGQLDSTKSASPNVQVIGKQVDRLIGDIELQIADFEGEIGKRLQIISPSKDGSITVEQLREVMQHIRNSPKDAEKLSTIISAYDQDGDGKIFIQDILHISSALDSERGQAPDRSSKL